MKYPGLYIHIPFCAKKCNYCDFLSAGNTSKEDHSLYIEALLCELRYYADSDIIFDTVYIGGGTPSLLDCSSIARIMDSIRSDFRLTEHAEVTVEANPDSLDKRKLLTYREIGINRLSIGAQSMDDGLLSFLGRIHTVDTFLRSYYSARNCGFQNISVDLMFSIPGQTAELWMDGLERVVGLNPEHISFYSMQIEEGTPFHKLWEEGTLRPVNDTEDRTMYHRTINRLENAGYLHYEISNAAKPGCESRHNLKYWSMGEYLGIGLGAHSYIGGIRRSNETDLNKYVRIAALPPRRGILNGVGPCTVWNHKNTKEDEMSDYMFTGLRKVSGIKLSEFKERFGTALCEIYADPVIKHKKTGLLKIDPDNDRLSLTLNGMDLFNQVLIDFI